MSRESWKSIVHGLGLAVLVVALSAGVGFAQVADPEGDADVPCVDIVSVDVTATTTSLTVTAEMSPRPYPPEYVINGIDDPNEYRLCPGGLYEVLLDTDRDGLADHVLRLAFDYHGEATVSGPDSLEVDYSIRQGEVTWNLSLDDLALSELPATIGLRVEAQVVNDGSFHPLVPVDVEDSFPDAWQEVVVGLDASRLVGPEGGTLSVGDAASPLFGLTMEAPAGALKQPTMVGLKDCSAIDVPPLPESLEGACVSRFRIYPAVTSWNDSPLVSVPNGEKCEPDFLEAFDEDAGRWWTQPYVPSGENGESWFVAALPGSEVETRGLRDGIMQFVRAMMGRQKLSCNAERNLYLAMTYLWPDQPNLFQELRRTLQSHQISRVLVNMGSTDSRGCVRWRDEPAHTDGDCHEENDYAEVAGYLKNLLDELPGNVSVGLWISHRTADDPARFQERISRLREDTRGLMAFLWNCDDGQSGGSCLDPADLERISEIHFDIEPLPDSEKLSDGRTYLQYVLYELIDALRTSPEGKRSGLEYSLFGERLAHLLANFWSKPDPWKWSREGLRQAVEHARVYYSLYDTHIRTKIWYRNKMRTSIQRAEEVCEGLVSQLIPVASSSDKYECPTEEDPKHPCAHTRAETVGAAAGALAGTLMGPDLGGFTLFIQSPSGEDGEPTAEEWDAFDSVFEDCHASFRDDFGDGLGKWILKGSPSPRWIDEIYGRQGVFDNNGDSWCANEAGTKQKFDLQPPFTLEGEVYLTPPNPSGCWQKAVIALSTKGDVDDPVCPGLWRTRTWIQIDYNGDACWATPPQYRRRAWVRALYFGADGEFHGPGSFTVPGDAYLGKWVRLRIVVDEQGIPSFYVEDQLVYQGDVPISPEELHGAQIVMGSRSSGSAGKAYHDWVELKPGVDAP